MKQLLNGTYDICIPKPSQLTTTCPNGLQDTLRASILGSSVNFASVCVHLASISAGFAKIEMLSRVLCECTRRPWRTTSPRCSHSAASWRAVLGWLHSPPPRRRTIGFRDFSSKLFEVVLFSLLNHNDV